MEIDPLPAVVDPHEALKGDVVLHPDFADNGVMGTGFLNTYTY